MIIFGINAVGEALRAGRVLSLHVGARKDRRIEELLAQARGRDVRVERVDTVMLDRMAGGGRHQGVVGTVQVPPARALEDLIDREQPSLIVVLDGIEDPQNVGAILRTVDAAGGRGLVRQLRRAAPLGGAAAKASAGAVAHVPVADVVNIARALQELKQLGLWIVGLEGRATTPYDVVDLTQPTALVLGSERRGMRRLVREQCDYVVSIPMSGQVESLNVSVAAGVVLFEAHRQRRRQGTAPVPAARKAR
ncbi:MAG: 23S rRNA (guanosine(2251)-2'-O)-methyltransferase RlmB [Luteitalea sp.]|nr:23S rRNA (guanosine(2251)-2'-O)-methyltransferase RlmB [Luteitalea sp.]